MCLTPDVYIGVLQKLTTMRRACNERLLGDCHGVNTSIVTSLYIIITNYSPAIVSLTTFAQRADRVRSWAFLLLCLQ